MMISLKEIEHKLEELPLLPDVVVRLLQLNPNDDDFFDQVLALSQEDPTFALQVIRLGNSASSAPISQIKSLEEAVARVGADAIAGLITSMAVLRVFVPVHPGEKKLWIHSIQVAVIAKNITSKLTHLKIDPNQAYLSGLLHDIGRFVMFDKAAPQLQEVEEKNFKSPEQLIEAELSIYGFNHSELGGKVCKKWGLPEVVRQIVAYHHMYSDKKQKAIQNYDAQLSNLLKVVQLADRLSVLLTNDPDTIKWPDEQLLPALQDCILPSLSTLDIKANHLKSIVQFADKETRRMLMGLQILT